MCSHPATCLPVPRRVVVRPAPGVRQVQATAFLDVPCPSLDPLLPSIPPAPVEICEFFPVTRTDQPGSPALVLNSCTLGGVTLAPIVFAGAAHTAVAIPAAGCYHVSVQVTFTSSTPDTRNRLRLSVCQVTDGALTPVAGFPPTVIQTDDVSETGAGTGVGIVCLPAGALVVPCLASAEDTVVADNVRISSASMTLFLRSGPCV
jgi:hypothetical protein